MLQVRGVERRLVGGGLVIALLLFLGFGASAVLGDGAVYALTIERSHFFERSIHVAYYVVGWIGSGLLRPLGMPTDRALIALNGVLMVGGLALAWAFFRALAVPRSIALASFFTLLFAGNILNEGTNVEIHALELLTVLASYLLFLRDRPAWAGLLFGIALLVTPLSSFGAGFFLWDAWRRRRWSAMAMTAALAAAIYGTVLAFCWHEYFFGVRGFLRAGIERPWGLNNVLYNGFAIVKNFHWATPFALIGAAWMARERDPLFPLLLITVVLHTPAYVGTRDNGVLGITTYPLLALAIGIGVIVTLKGLGRRTGRIVVQVVGGLYALTSLYLWLDPPGPQYHERFIALLREAPEGSAVVSTWSNLTALEYYAHHHGLTLPRLIDSRVVTPEEMHAAADRHPTIYALEGLYPNRLSYWLPKSWAEWHYRGQAVVPKVAAMLGTRPVILTGHEPMLVVFGRGRAGGATRAAPSVAPGSAAR